MVWSWFKKLKQRWPQTQKRWWSVVRRGFRNCRNRILSVEEGRRGEPNGIIKTKRRRLGATFYPGTLCWIGRVCSLPNGASPGDQMKIRQPPPISNYARFIFSMYCLSNPVYRAVVNVDSLDLSVLSLDRGTDLTLYLLSDLA